MASLSIRRFHTSAAVLGRGSRPSKHKFTDKIRVQVAGGRGGRGVVSFEALSHAKKRPVGGHGGAGGDVVLEASQSVADLSFSSFVFKGEDGADASGKGKNGGRGKHKRVLVPCGTTVKEITRTFDYSAELPEEYTMDPEDEGWSDSELEAEGFSGPSSAFTMPEDLRRELLRLSGRANHVDTLTTLGELDQHQDRLVVARGGRPGYGNRHLQRGEETPETPHIVGVAGEQRFLQLEMKGIADVGLVGFPNAGKSSLLRCLSRAKPKVASYPFTTLHPHLGVVKFKDTMALTVADIPGIVEGAHANRGLGHEFLRHIQRTQVLLYVVDVGSPGCRPVEDLACLRQELELFDPDLPRRPSIVVANKMDLEGAEEGLQALRRSTTLPVMPISAADKQNIAVVVDSMRWLLEQQARAAHQRTLTTFASPAFRM